MSGHAYLRGKVGGGIKLPFDRGPMRLNGFQNVLKERTRCGINHNAGLRRLIPPLADSHMLKLEGPAHHQNDVQDLGQDQRVNDVSTDADGFLMMAHRVSPRLNESTTGTSSIESE